MGPDHSLAALHKTRPNPSAHTSAVVAIVDSEKRSRRYWRAAANAAAQPGDSLAALSARHIRMRPPPGGTSAQNRKRSALQARKMNIASRGRIVGIGPGGGAPAGPALGGSPPGGPAPGGPLSGGFFSRRRSTSANRRDGAAAARRKLQDLGRAPSLRHQAARVRRLAVLVGTQGR